MQRSPQAAAKNRTKFQVRSEGPSCFEISAATHVTLRKAKACGIRAKRKLARIAPRRSTLPHLFNWFRNRKASCRRFGSDRASDSDLADVRQFFNAEAAGDAKSRSRCDPINGQRLFVKDCLLRILRLSRQGPHHWWHAPRPPQFRFPPFVSYVREPTGRMPP